MTKTIAMGMEYETHRRGKLLHVKVNGQLDAQTAPVLEDGLRDKLEGVTEITFDLGDLEYISSAGLRILLASYKIMDKRGGSMQIEHATGDVLNILNYSGFALLFGME